MDKVSVIIPTYNRFNYLLNTINSIKNQTYSYIAYVFCYISFIFVINFKKRSDETLYKKENTS